MSKHTEPASPPREFREYVVRRCVLIVNNLTEAQIERWNDAIHVIEKSAYDALKLEADRHNEILDQYAENKGWVPVYQRNDLILEVQKLQRERDEARAEVKRLGLEVEELMKVDYWQDRHNIVKKALNECLDFIEGCMGWSAMRVSHDRHELLVKNGRIKREKAEAKS